MKSTVSILSVALALGFGLIVASPAQAGESVYSVNIVGFQSETMPKGGEFTLLTSPFETGMRALSDLFSEGTLVGDSAPGAADRIRLWNPDTQTYLSIGVGHDGKFYRQTAAGGWVLPLEEVDPTVEIGDAFWLVSAGFSDEERGITFAGDVVLDSVISRTIFPGFHVLSYPFSTSVHIQDMGFDTSDATGDSAPGGADRIRAWDRNEQRYIYFGLGPDQQWYNQTPAGSWVLPLELADYVFQPGEGFFYFSQNTFEWEVSNPYSSMLAD